MITQPFTVEDEVIREIIERVRRKFSMKPKVAFAGFGNSGKSSLFNFIYGEKVASVSMKTDDTTPENMSTKERFGIDFTDTPGFGTEKFSFEAVAPLLEGQHVVVHVLNGAAAISNDDHRLQKMLRASTARAVTVVNKVDLLELSEVNDYTTSVMQADLGLAPGQFLFASAKQGTNIASLVNWIAEILPVAMRDAFIAQQQVDMELKERGVRAAIKKTATTAATVASVPIVADIFLLTPLQIGMVAAIGCYHGVEISEARAKEFMEVVGAGVGLREIARQVLKVVPGWGSVFSAAVAFAGTTALGEAAHAWFKSDMKMPADELRDVFRLAARSAKVEYEAKKTAITTQAELLLSPGEAGAAAWPS